MKSVWVVVGYTGEYEDRQKWNVAAFSRSREANSLRDRLNRRGCEGQGIHWERREAIVKELNAAGDPNASVDYTGTWYSVDQIELRS